jgi:hypothetical protein
MGEKWSKENGEGAPFGVVTTIQSVNLPFLGTLKKPHALTVNCLSWLKRLIKRVELPCFALTKNVAISRNSCP